MDELGALILGTRPEAKSSESKTSVISDQLLDSLRRVESGKDPYAMNKDTKAMGAYQFMPETVQMLHKQGVKFNPFDEQEARGAAKKYLEQLVQRNNGDVNKALAQYGGFVTKDPSKYVQNVTQGAQQPQQVQQTQQQAPQDELGAMILGKQGQSSQPMQNQPMQQSTAGGGRGSYAGFDPQAKAIAEGQSTRGPMQSSGNAAIDLANQFQQSRKNLPGLLASTADVVASAPSAIAGTVGYGAGRLFGLSPEQATESSQKLAGALAEPVGRLTGLSQTQGYRQSLPTKIMEYIGQNIGEGAQSIAQKFGVPVADVENSINAVMMGGGAVAPKVIRGFKSAAADLQMQQQFQAKSGLQSAGAAATTDQATVNAMLAKVSPELQNEIRATPINQLNMPALERHVEADTLPVPMRLTRGQATQNINLLSDEMNMRGKNPELANRFNEQNGKLIENMNAIRDKAAPDVYGTNHIENAETVINAYKALDDTRTADISAKYKALKDAAGGDFPIDGKQFAINAEKMLGKDLKTDFLPPAIAKQLDRYKNGETMTFENFEAMRTNLAAEMRKAERSGDGNAKTASSIVRTALEELPLTGEAEALKPLANEARSAAKARFDMLKKDPAYKAAVDDIVPADKYIDKFVINGVNKNINTMVQNLGKDSPAHQHMAAGTVNWLKDKAGIVDETGNFRQDSYNRALKKLEDVKNLQEIFNPEAASQLKTLGNVARYTQAQPRGAFVNNSNTLVGAMADKAAYAMEQGANIVGGGKMGIPIGSMIRSRVQQYKATKETEKALETGAGTKQTGQ